MKNIVLIGNKIMNEKLDCSKFDMIVGVNRLLNLNKLSSKKIDLWLIDIWESKLENLYKLLPKQVQGISFTHSLNSLNSKYVNNLQVVDYNQKYLYKYFPEYDFIECRPTNTIWMLLYLIEHYPKSNIYLWAVDVEDRSFLQDIGYAHRRYHLEEDLLKKLIKENKIYVLPNNS